MEPKLDVWSTEEITSEINGLGCVCVGGGDNVPKWERERERWNLGQDSHCTLSFSTSLELALELTRTSMDMYKQAHTHTAWCNEIGYLTSLDACKLRCIQWHRRTNFTAPGCKHTVRHTHMHMHTQNTQNDKRVCTFFLRTCLQDEGSDRIEKRPSALSSKLKVIFWPASVSVASIVPTTVPIFEFSFTLGLLSGKLSCPLVDLKVVLIGASFTFWTTIEKYCSIWKYM